MKEKVSLLEAFNAMRCYLSCYYFETLLDDVGSFCGDIQLCSGYDNTEKNPQTWDPAAWQDWMSSVNVVLGKKNLVGVGILLTKEQAYSSMKKMLDEYGKRTESQDITDLVQKLSTDKQKSDWEKCLHIVLYEDVMSYIKSKKCKQV